MLSTSHLSQLPAASVCDALGSRTAGLNQTEIAQRLLEYGPNSVPVAPGKPWLGRLAAQFVHFFALLLWAGGALALVAGMPALGWAIFGVIVINAVFSFAQEYQAERAVAALRKLAPQRARVRRRDELTEVLAESLVPGDILLLAAGDRISADARLVEANDLVMDQSVLTGESRTVGKGIDEAEADHIGPLELHNVVFAGTTAVSGTGEAVVYATGLRTQFGGIVHAAQQVEPTLSPLQQEIKRASRWVAVLAVGLGAVFFALSAVGAGLAPATAFMLALGIIVANVPEGLLPTVTLALALGVQRMAKQRAIVKELPKVETMGCVTVICSDKTGTLTENQMTVTALWLDGRALPVTGSGYDPQGVIGEGRAAVESHPTTKSLLERFLLCGTLDNNSALGPPSAERDFWNVVGDPMEGALHTLALKGGVDPREAAERFPRLRELPFDAARKRMGTVHDEAGRRVLYVKGAPLETLSVCADEAAGDGAVPLTPKGRARIVARNDAFAAQGLRVLALAFRTLPADAGLGIRSAERDLTFLGLVALEDPPRPEVPAAIEQCRRSGIRVIMITGDYSLTAEAIARRLGLVHGSDLRVITGYDLGQMADDELERALGGEVLFARAAPTDKLRVVRALQRLGHVVAVTGDGVNDVPALKQADIGIAMGLTGTDAAREACDMIIADDNFATIVNAIAVGRGVYQNIRKFLTYVMVSNVAEMAPYVAFALFGLPLALTVMQVLAVDLGTDMAPALALGAEAPEPGIMDRPPRQQSEHLLTIPLLLRVYGFLGLLEAFFGLAGFFVFNWLAGWRMGEPLPVAGPVYEQATTITFAAIVSGQIGCLFACRSERVSAFRLSIGSNPLLLAGIAVELAIAAGLIYLPGLQEGFGMRPFTGPAWV
ncbi:MAG: cation-transporting P-type ATPase [Chloroflexota bacterium]